MGCQSQLLVLENNLREYLVHLRIFHCHAGNVALCWLLDFRKRLLDRILLRLLIFVYATVQFPAVRNYFRRYCGTYVGVYVCLSSILDAAVESNAPKARVTWLWLELQTAFVV